MYTRSLAALVGTAAAFATALSGAAPASAGLSPSNEILVWNSANPSPTALSDVTEPLDGKTLTQVSTGDHHTCALDRAGRAYCWGSDGYGELGDAAAVPGWKPTAVDRSGVLAGVRFTTISAGGAHTCALSREGHAYCWGRGDSGQRGDGSKQSKATSPVAVGGRALKGRFLIDIAAGAAHTCAIDKTGRAFCWGEGSNGRLGDGTTRDRTRAVPVDRSGALRGRTLAGISAGGAHTCAIDDAGRAYCWGRGDSGQLGNGNQVTHRRPVAVDRSRQLKGVRLRQISAGHNFTCGIDRAGATYCWGEGRAGQLGDDSGRASAVPVRVAQDARAFAIGSLDAGRTASCAATASGRAFCWGKGSLGSGVNQSDRTQPVDVSAVPKGLGFTDLAVTTGDTGQRGCAIGDNGRAYCWGSDQLGRLGQTVKPLEVYSSGTSDIPAGAVLSSLTASGTHRCVLDSDGKAYCWGSNYGGELGIGPSADVVTARPAAVVSDGALAGVTLTRISAGAYNTCALDASGKAYCWGGSGDRVGDGTTNVDVRHREPVAVDTSGVLAGKMLTQISVGYAQSCAIASNGKAYCWGWGSSGVLGNGSTADAPSPVAVDTSGVLAGKTLTGLATGPFHTCALDSDGKAYCWGDGIGGALGNGSTADSSVPVAVEASGVLSGKTLVAITANERYTCALDTAGKAYCWGERALGGNATSSSTPVAVDDSGVLSGRVLTQISAGYSHACARDTQGRAYCWGVGTSGQLGDGLSTTSATPVAVDAGGALNGLFVTEIAAGDGQTFALAEAS